MNKQPANDNFTSNPWVITGMTRMMENWSRSDGRYEFKVYHNVPVLWGTKFKSSSFKHAVDLVKELQPLETFVVQDEAAFHSTTLAEG